MTQPKSLPLEEPKLDQLSWLESRLDGLSSTDERLDFIARLILYGIRLGQEKKAKESLGGEDGTRSLSATSQVQELNLISEWPYSPWISLFITNDGPNTLFIAINHPHQWKEIRMTESRTITHENADERISKVYYKCNADETALARIDGQY